MSFAMPDISLQSPRPQVQIPYLPDFWESSPAKSPQPAEPPLPKLSVVSDLDTVHSHNLHDENAAPATQPAQAPRAMSSGKGGILRDMSEDLGIPSAQEIKTGVSKFLQSFR
ncbi:hypothetical protein DFH09DRAFT_1133161 [Mycena vulgaris]|nr:hypothetical protein DFH09DRAFT_1133161 [Mycena vulgaris]